MPPLSHAAQRLPRRHTARFSRNMQDRFTTPREGFRCLLPPEFGNGIPGQTCLVNARGRVRTSYQCSGLARYEALGPMTSVARRVWGSALGPAVPAVSTPGGFADVPGPASCPSPEQADFSALHLWSELGTAGCGAKANVLTRHTRVVASKGIDCRDGLRELMAQVCKANKICGHNQEIDMTHVLNSQRCLF